MAKLFCAFLYGTRHSFIQLPPNRNTRARQTRKKTTIDGKCVTSASFLKKNSRYQHTLSLPIVEPNIWIPTLSLSYGHLHFALLLQIKRVNPFQLDAYRSIIAFHNNNRVVL